MSGNKSNNILKVSPAVLRDIQKQAKVAQQIADSLEWKVLRNEINSPGGKALLAMANSVNLLNNGKRGSRDDEVPPYSYDSSQSIIEQRINAITHYIKTVGLNEDYFTTNSASDFWAMLYNCNYLGRGNINIFNPCSDKVKYRTIKGFPTINLQKGRKS